LIVRKALALVSAIAAMAAAAAVCVVAAAYGLYAFAREFFDPAPAAALIAAAFALLAVILAFATFRNAQPDSLRRSFRHGREEPSATARLIELARERPIVTAAAAAAVGFVILRNPKLLGTAITAAIASRAGAVQRDRRR
jgi:ABC-type nickel/cobalt efflux system permease component RcnA